MFDFYPKLAIFVITCGKIEVWLKNNLVKNFLKEFYLTNIDLTKFLLLLGDICNQGGKKDSQGLQISSEVTDGLGSFTYMISSTSLGKGLNLI